MKKVRIPGSKFDLCLEDQENQWYLRLRIQEKVEEELPLTLLDKKLIRQNIEELIEKVHLSISDIQLQLIQKEIWEAIEETLNKNKAQGQKKTYGNISDPRVDNLIERIEKISSRIKTLEERVSTSEMKLT